MASGTPDEVLPEETLTLRVKCKLSQNITLRDVSSSKKMEEFLRELSKLTSVPHDQMALLRGFPPKRIAYDPSMTLQSLGIVNQDTIIVEFDKAGFPGGILPGSQGSSQPLTAIVSNSPNSLLSHVVSPMSTATAIKIESQSGSKSLKDMSNSMQRASSPTRRPDSTSSPAARTDLRGPVRGASQTPFQGASADPDNSPLGSSGVVMRKVVASDNSCLFSAITFCITGAEGASSADLRELIATTVLNDPEKYNEGYLGRSNLEYVEWISRFDSWGGGIELAIISEFYSIEINVMDTQHLRINRFGEDREYSNRIFLIYDGIHYDALYLERYDGSQVVTMFPAGDTSVYDQVMDLGREANANHQYTDVKNFTLLCEECQARFHGPTEARAHAESTGHKKFAEYK